MADASGTGSASTAGPSGVVVGEPVEGAGRGVTLQEIPAAAQAKKRSAAFVAAHSKYRSSRISPEGEDGQEALFRPPSKSFFDFFKGNAVIHPSDPLKVKWDLHVAALIMYSCITVPFVIAFDEDIEGDGMDKFDIYVDLMFLMDMIVTCWTAVNDPCGNLIWSQRAVCEDYAKGWLFVDFVTTFPFDRIVQAAEPNTDAAQLRVIKMLRIVRLVRLVKIIKKMKLGEFLDEHEHIIPVNRSFLAIVNMLLGVMFIGHILGCVWYMLTSSNKANWYNQMYSCEGPTMQGMDDDWVQARGPNPHPDCGQALSLKYTASLYWAITTMATVGYGDINTQNPSEQGYAIFVMLIGATTFGYTLGMVSGLVSNINPSAMAKSRKIGTLKAFCHENNLPIEMQLRLNRQWRYMFRQKCLFDERRFFETLPPHLCKEMLKADTTAHLRKQLTSLLGNDAMEANYTQDDYFISEVIPLLKPLFANKDDELVQQQGIGLHMYWINAGKVELSLTTGESEQPVLVATRTRGQSFAEAFLTSTDTSLTSAKVVEEGQTELVALARRDYKATLEKWDEFKEDLEAAAEHHRVEVATAIANATAAKAEPTATSGESAVVAFHAPQKEQRKKVKITFKQLWKEHMLFHPESPRKIAWDMFIGLMIMYSVIMVPYQIAFATQASGPMLFVEIFIDIFFGIDMIVSFNTAYITATVNRSLVTDKKMIAGHYFRTWFIIDLVTTFPIDRIAKQFVSQGGALRSIKLLRVLRLFRLLKLAKLLQNGPMQELFADATMNVNPACFQLPYLYCYLLFCAHLLGCLWRVTASMEDNDGWAGSFSVFVGSTSKTSDGREILVSTPTKDLPLNNQYLVSLYWAITTMTTVGYGDLSASSHSVVEMWVALIVMLVGTTIFAYVVGEVVLTVMNLDPAKRSIGSMVRGLKGYIESRNFNVKFRKLAVVNLHNRVQFHTVFEEQMREIWADMPEFLMRDIVIFKYMDTIERHGFDKIDSELPGFCMHMVPMLRPLELEKADYLFKAGDSLRLMFFIERGMVKTAERGDASRSWKKGDHLCGPLIFMPRGRSVRVKQTIIAAQPTMLLAFSMQDLYTLTKLNPECRKVMQELVDSGAEKDFWVQ